MNCYFVKSLDNGQKNTYSDSEKSSLDSLSSLAKVSKKNIPLLSDPNLQNKENTFNMKKVIIANNNKFNFNFDHFQNSLLTITDCTSSTSDFSPPPPSQTGDILGILPALLFSSMLIVFNMEKKLFL